MSSKKQEKPKVNIPILKDTYYWVKGFNTDQFEPAKCKELYGTDKLYFFFTNGSRMQIEGVWDVRELGNYIEPNLEKHNEMISYWAKQLQYKKLSSLELIENVTWLLNTLKKP